MNRTVLLALLAAFVLPQGRKEPADAAAAARSIQLQEVKAKMSFLGSDELGGRLVGTLQDNIAAVYIASEFMQLGLKPLGDGESYFQDFDVASAWPAKDNATVFASTINNEKKVYQRGHDYEPWWVQSVNSEHVSSPSCESSACSTVLPTPVASVRCENLP